MEKISLGENGPSVSPVIYSFWRALEDPDGISYRTVQAKLQACLDLGITTYDHADASYNNDTLFSCCNLCNSSKCVANNFLLAVTTCFPLFKASFTML